MKTAGRDYRPGKSAFFKFLLHYFPKFIYYGHDTFHLGRKEVILMSTRFFRSSAIFFGLALLVVMLGSCMTGTNIQKPDSRRDIAERDRKLEKNLNAADDEVYAQIVK